MISLTNTGCGFHQPHLDLGDHPVFQALPDRFQSTALARRRLTSLPAGQALEEDGFLSFVLTGVLGLFPKSDGVCVRPSSRDLSTVGIKPWSPTATALRLGR